MANHLNQYEGAEIKLAIGFKACLTIGKMRMHWERQWTNWLDNAVQNPDAYVAIAASMRRMFGKPPQPVADQLLVERTITDPGFKTMVEIGLDVLERTPEMWSKVKSAMRFFWTVTRVAVPLVQNFQWPVIGDSSHVYTIPSMDRGVPERTGNTSAHVIGNRRVVKFENDMKPMRGVGHSFKGLQGGNCASNTCLTSIQDVARKGLMEVAGMLTSNIKSGALERCANQAVANSGFITKDCAALRYTYLREVKARVERRFAKPTNYQGLCKVWMREEFGFYSNLLRMAICIKCKHIIEKFTSGNLSLEDLNMIRNPDTPCKVYYCSNCKQYMRFCMVFVIVPEGVVIDFKKKEAKVTKDLNALFQNLPETFQLCGKTCTFQTAGVIEATPDKWTHALNIAHSSTQPPVKVRLCDSKPFRWDEPLPQMLEEKTFMVYGVYSREM